MITHKQISEKLNSYIDSRFIEEKTYGPRGFICKTQEGPMSIIPVITDSKPQILENIIKENSDDNIPTLLIFSQEFYSKKENGHYKAEHGKMQPIKTNGTYITARPLSESELLWMKLHGNPIYNYHPKNNEINSYSLKKIPFETIEEIAIKLMIKETRPSKYPEIKKRFNDLTKEIEKYKIPGDTLGIRTYTNLHETKKIKKINMINEIRDRLRQVLKYEGFQKKKHYTLKAVQRKGLLFAHPVPYQQEQMNLFH